MGREPKRIFINLDKASSSTETDTTSSPTETDTLFFSDDPIIQLSAISKEPDEISELEEVAQDTSSETSEPKEVAQDTSSSPSYLRRLRKAPSELPEPGQSSDRQLLFGRSLNWSYCGYNVYRLD